MELGCETLPTYITIDGELLPDGRVVPIEGEHIKPDMTAEVTISVDAVDPGHHRAHPGHHRSQIDDDEMDVDGGVERGPDDGGAAGGRAWAVWEGGEWNLKCV